MSISFQTNVASMIAANNLNVNNNFQTQTITQLTSGYRINNSGDDAAGLAVANQYRSNVAELTQGVMNGNDGVSTLQIIDGGLSNISTMLDRMKTLATESASTTFTGNRATLNAEYQTLVNEITREAGNVGLSAGDSTNAANLSVYIGGGKSSTVGSEVNINLSNGKVDAAALGLSGTGVGGNSPVTIGTSTNTTVGVGATESFTVNTAAGSATFGITGQNGDTATTQLARLNADLGTVGLSASLDATGALAFSSPDAFYVSITGAGLATGGETGVNKALYDGQITYDGGANVFDVTEGSKTAKITMPTTLSDSAAIQSINQQLSSAGITDMQAVATGTTGTYSLQAGSSFTLAVDATSVGAGAGVTNPANTPSGGGALSAINSINAAVQSLGTVQGIVGAGENDLNYAIGLANSQITNFSSAESGIRDADVAKEAANLTKAQVLEQASVAAMAQANSAPQVILALLKT
jgi:flagellin